MSRLHRVSVSAKGEPPTVAEIHRMVAKMEPLLRGMLAQKPDALAHHDQLAAHERTTTRVFDALAAAGIPAFGHPGGSDIGHPRTTTDRGHALAMRLRLQIATLRHVEWRCEHARWPPDGQQRLLADLTCRAVCCGRPACIARVQRRYAQADRRCELCEQPAEQFTPHVMPLGPLAVKVEACPACAAWLSDGPVPDEQDESEVRY